MKDIWHPNEYVDFRSVFAPAMRATGRNGVTTEDEYLKVRGKQVGTMWGRPVFLMEEDRTHPPIVRTIATPASDIVSQHTT